MIDKNTNEIHNNLLELQKHLEKLKSASQQMDEVKKIAKELIASSGALPRKYDSHLENVVREFNIWLEQNKSLVQGQFEEIKKKHSILISKIKEDINNLNESLADNISKYEEIRVKQNDKINEHLSLYSDYVLKLEELTRSIENVDFPSRLDKIDNSISAINIGVQNLQSAIAATEKNIGNKIDNFSEGVDEKFKNLGSTTKGIKLTLWLIGIVLIILSMVTVYKLFL